MNLMGLSIPEEYGGVGDFLDLVVVLEEMGRACYLGPFFSTVVLGASAIMEAGSEKQKQEYLPAIAEGKLIMTMAIAESSGKYSADGIQVKAELKGNDYIINGTKMFVPDAHVADYLVCVARTKESGNPEEGITLFLIDKNTSGLTCQLLKTLSGDKQCEVTFDNVTIPAECVLGEPNNGWQYVEKILQKANVAACAEMVGLAQQALNLSLEYAKERIAFGHPIGAFQSIQHRCADMLIDVDGSRFLTHQAAWRINENLPAAREVAIAKSWVGQACRRVMHSAHQIHGAVGFTDDHILHYYTKKARASEFNFGGVDYHLERVS
jgi:alkylation response protein AidB-like acyl-CoA dehydrogenase